VLASAALLSGERAHAQTQISADSIRALAFDRFDRTSRSLLATVWCARNAGELRATGVVGPTDSVGRTGLCVRKDGRALAVYFTPDSTYSKAGNVRVADVAGRVRYRGPIDTVAVLAEARASMDAVLRGFALFQKEKRAFAPVSMRSDGDSIEVWLLPLGLFAQPTPAAIGGERAYVYSPDGRTLVREIDAFDRHRALTVPDTGLVEIVSREDDLPLVSELIATNLIHTSGREVRVVTAAVISQLVRGPPEAWVQLKRRP